MPHILFCDSSDLFVALAAFGQGLRKRVGFHDTLALRESGE